MPNCLKFEESVRSTSIVITVLVLLTIIIIPIPALILDILIALNLTISFLILFTVVQSKKPADFSLLPTVILISTIFNLVVNISAARLILTKGSAFNGRLIGLVSSLFTGSDDTAGLIAGFVVFIIIVSIHLRIIIKGNTRVSEAAAR